MTWTNKPNHNIDAEAEVWWLHFDNCLKIWDSRQTDTGRYWEAPPLKTSKDWIKPDTAHFSPVLSKLHALWLYNIRNQINPYQTVWRLKMDLLTFKVCCIYFLKEHPFVVLIICKYKPHHQTYEGSLFAWNIATWIIPNCIHLSWNRTKIYIHLYHLHLNYLSHWPRRLACAMRACVRHA